MELVLAGNGPGELNGWIAPVARAARHEAGSELHLTLALLPSQFASGREGAVVRTWNLFDRILEPATCVRAAAGLEAVPVTKPAVLIHLGGDLWLSGRLAKRFGIPACALAETELIARRHQPFARVFAVSPEVARALVAQGVPEGKIVVTGDPRGDAISEIATTPPDRASTAPGDAGHIVSILPGSRARIFEAMVPYFLNVASALAGVTGNVGFRVIVSPYLAVESRQRAQELAARRWPRLPVEWITDGAWEALATSDLVLTIPGTNTMELAMLGVPFAVVVDTDLVALAPIEGVLEWMTRVPGIGAALRRALLLRYLSRLRFAALPNMRLGRAVVPEWVGRWRAEDLAKQVAALLAAPEQRVALRQTLRKTFRQPPGAARAIAASARVLAERSADP